MKDRSLQIKEALESLKPRSGGTRTTANLAAV